MQKDIFPEAWSANGPVPIIVERTDAQHIGCLAVLDTGQTYLDHHRPGGDPLLGTVMGIEAMARAARFLDSKDYLFCISDVQIGTPYILNCEELQPRRIRINASFDHIDGDETSILCEVLSEGRDDVSERHFTGVFRMSRIPYVKIDRIKSHFTSGIPGVTAADIYGLFFHGTWYRVIAEAGMQDDAVVARYAAGCEELTGSNCYAAAPRVIEFCLQTAGLFELAETGRMMIPHTIRRIEQWSGINEAETSGLTAIARRSKKVDGLSCDPGSIDIIAVDAEGHPCMRVTGYDTHPLPFPADEVCIARLQKLLKRSLR
jgi:hypothetical protein